MKKILFGIAVLFAVLVFATGFDVTPESKKISIGSDMPVVHLSNQKTKLDVGTSSDRYILMTFWESLDAESRIACSKYNTYFSHNKPEGLNVDFVAVNFDKDETLCREIIAIDNLDADTQFRLDNFQTLGLKAAFELDHGMGSVLVDPTGKIIAFNPSVSELEKLIL